MIQSFASKETEKFFNLVEKKEYEVIGEPQDLSSARQLAQDDRYQSQWWALLLIQAQPIGVFITLEEAAKDMRAEVASAGFNHSPNWNKDYPRTE